MDTEKNHQLIFIPGPGMGHLVAEVEFANLLLNQNLLFSITFLLIPDPQSQDYTKSLHTNSNSRLRFIKLPEADQDPSSEPETKPAPVLAMEHIDRHQSQVRNAVLALLESKSRISGFVIDMFCVSMGDVADEFNIPVYTFFTSSAAFLSLKFCALALHESGVDVTEYKDTDKEFLVPGFLNRVPAKVLPSVMLDKSGGSVAVLNSGRKIRGTKGVLVNTFQELESRYVESLLVDGGCLIPPVYAVGPVLNLNCERKDGYDDEIIGWLDEQPARSVVFLCFGSLGRLGPKQIREIAVALESSGHRFLLSLGRLPCASGSDDVLPIGFLDRTSGIGKVIGWAPQVAVLSHSAIGGFVSHCGWNSILESLWFGVPIAAWPMYAEQQVNAFEMVVELGMAVEIKMDYREEMGDDNVVTAEEIERGIKQLMELENDTNGISERVKDAMEKSRRALVKGGSSYRNLGRLIDDILLQNCSDLEG